MSRLAGHTLASEGAPYVVNVRQEVVRANPTGTGGFGRGLCSCGELGRLLSSGLQRKAWHREHKGQAAS